MAIHGDVREVARGRCWSSLAPRAGASIAAAGWRSSTSVRQAMPTQSYDRAGGDEPQPRVRLRRAGAASWGERRSPDVVATFDVGTHQMKGAQWFPVSRPRSFVTSGGMGSMGCALPMAVGAWFARPEATVVACVGDGGFVMSSHELDTIGGYGIPVKIVLFDDSLLGMVTNWHSLFFDGRKLTSDRRRGRRAGADRRGRAEARSAPRLAGATSVDVAVDALRRRGRRLAAGEWPLFAADGRVLRHPGRARPHQGAVPRRPRAGPSPRRGRT